ncbi:18118_t:CDS:2, partial [Gigaspora rosea]
MQEPFLVAQKFEMEKSVTMGWNGSVPHLNALIQGLIYEMQDINCKTINVRKLYSEAWGKARAALAVAVRRHNKIEAGSNISNKKLNPKVLANPYKRKARGWPKGTDRIRRAYELPKKQSANCT